MKKAIFLLSLAVFCLVLAGGVFWGFLNLQQQRYLDSSAQFISDVVEPALRQWRQSYLEDYGSSDFKRALAGDRMRLYFNNLKRVGNLEDIRSVEGTLGQRDLLDFDSPVTAHYVLDTQFSNTQANVQIDLVVEDGAWKLSSLTIDALMLAD